MNYRQRECDQKERNPMENIPLKVLCLEDSPRDVEIMRELLVDAGYDLNMECTAVEKEFADLLRSRAYDIILADFKLPGFDAFAALRWARDICPNVPFICVSGSIGEETAVELLKQGAVDYILKDRLAKLPSAISRALGEAKEREARQSAEEALRESEHRLRRLYESALIGVIYWNMNGQIMDANDKFLEMVGYNRDELVAGLIDWGNMTPPEFRHLDDASVVELKVTGVNKTPFEKEYIRKDGTRVPIVLAGAMLDENRFNGVAFVLDITERKRAEETLQKSEKRLREAQEMAHLGFWDWDVKTGNVLWSDEVFKIFCLDPKEFTPHIDSILALSPWPEDHRRDQELINKAIETHTPGSYEQKFLRPDQSIGHYYSTFQGVYDEKGELISIVGTVLDITDRKRAEEKLSASEIRFRRLFESAKDGILILDAGTGMVVDVNPFLVELLGCSQAEFMGKKVWELGLLKDVIANKDKFLELQEQDYVRYENLPLQAADGKQINVEFVSNVYLVDHMKVVQCNIRNITERRRAEEKILRQLEELRRWQEVTLGREDRNRELKREVNELLGRLGETIRYPSQESTSDKQETANG
jgi:PAS domain S-box-containing protein